ncbi:MAG: hypothetical protein KF767_12625 [Bdellovibrionaceae bacterium]|nr:hypothetical protein [Pseudobdellovibrionaceae bacterium]
MIRTLVAALALPLLLLGCSNSGSSGPARPAASPEMTKQATHALSSVQKLFEIKSSSSKTSPRPSPRHIAWMALDPIFPPGTGNDTTPGSTPGTSKPASPDKIRLNADNSARNIEKVLSPNDCVFDLPIDKDPGTSAPPANGAPSMDVDIKDMRASISGPNCPLEALIEIKGGKVGNNIQATILMNLTAKTPAMQQELRAKTISLRGTISGTIVQGNDQSVAADVRGTLGGQGELLTGEVFSTAINYGMKMNMTMPDENSMPTPPNNGGTGFGPLPLDFFNMEMSQSQRYDFGDSATTLAMSASMKGFSEFKESYSINGRNATRAEFEEYASQIALPGMQEPGPGQDSTPIGPGPGGDRPVMCTLTAYDARETSLRSLEDAIHSGTAIRGFPLQTLRSCKDNVTTEFKDPTIGQVRMSVQHSFDYVIGAVSVNGRPHDLYLPRDYESKIAGENAGVTMLFQCQPVVQCGP